MVANINALLNQVLSDNRGGPRVRGAGCRASDSEGSCRLEKKPETGGSDKLALSEPLQSLKDTGIDLAKSTFVEQAGMFNFDLRYTDEQIKNVSANGCYDSRSQSLKVDFSFCSALSVTDASTGQEHQELFQFDFHLEASRIQSVRTEHKVVKEDIIQFARKIVGAISKLHAEGKSVDGLVLDKEDLKELAAVDDGKLLKSIMALISLMHSVNQMLGRNGEHVLLKPERAKTEYDEQQGQDIRSFNMSLSVRRLSVDSVQAGAGLANDGSTAESAEDTSTADALSDTAPIQDTAQPAATAAA